MENTYSAKQILKEGVVDIHYFIVKEEDKYYLQLQAKHLPDELHNAYLNMDVTCSDSSFTGLAHEAGPSGNWILANIKLNKV